MERRQMTFALASVARAVMVTLAVLAIGLFLWAGRSVLFLVFFGALFGVFLTVFTSRMVRWGLPRIPSLALVLLTALGLIYLFTRLLLPTVSEQMKILTDELPAAVEGIHNWVETTFWDITGPDQDLDLEEETREKLLSQLDVVVVGAIPIISTAIGALASLFVVFTIGIYTAANPHLYRRGFGRLIPPTRRPQVEAALDRTGHSLRLWMVGTLINMVVVGVMTGTGLWLLGVPAPVALGVLAGLLEFISIVGPILAALPAIALAFTISPMTAVWVILFYLVVQQLESNILTPVVMRGTVHLPPALTLFFQSLMTVVFGFLGLLLAVPILAVARSMVTSLYIEPMEDGHATRQD